MKKLFGTDGIRGKAGEYPITEKVCYSAGIAFGKILDHDTVVLIGSDTRDSSSWISETLKKGLESQGIAVEDAGIIPTPVLAYSVKTGDYSGGIMVTASHNPWMDNGIKFFSQNGRKLNESLENTLEKMIHDLGDTLTPSLLNKVPLRNSCNTQLAKNYINHIKTHIDLSKIKSIPGLDCANGAASYFIQEFNQHNNNLLKPIHIQPNGKNINYKCGAAAVSDIEPGFAALDGDGDRIIFKTDNNDTVNGDVILMFLTDKLGLKSLTGTVMTNQAVESFCNKRGIAFYRTDVGDKYVRENMDSTGCLLGGETSGHIILEPVNFTGDGFAVYLKLVELMNQQDITLNDLLAMYPLFPQDLYNIKVEKKLPFEEIPGFMDMCSSAADILEKDGGRIFPRYSGTENLLRILIETESYNVLESVGQILKKYLQNSELAFSITEFR